MPYIYYFIFTMATLKGYEKTPGMMIGVCGPLFCLGGSLGLTAYWKEVCWTVD